MATLNFLITAMALFFIPSAYAAAVVAPAPSALSPSPSATETKDEIIWESCARKMTADCGHDVVTTFLGTNPNDDLSIECCSQLLNMGVECHSTMVNLLLADNDFNKDKSTITAKSTEVWNLCVLELETEDLSPAPTDSLDE